GTVLPRCLLRAGAGASTICGRRGAQDRGRVTMWTFLHQLASPPHFYALAARLIPWLAVAGLLALLYGTVAGLFFAPPDYQQGDAFRIIYVHGPAAYLSLLAYVVMAVAAGIGLVWRMKLAHAVAASAAPLGAWFTFLALL